MPTLGFLKKKRTKDSPGGDDPASPSSPIRDSPITSAPNSAGHSTFPTNSSPTSYPLSQPVSNKSNEPNQPASDGQPQPASTSTPQNANIGHSAIESQQSTNQTNGEDSSKPLQVDGANQSQMEGRGNGATPARSAAPAQPVIRSTKGKYTLTDFTMQRTLGTGSFGRVHLVQSKHNQRFYAVKVLKKQQVVKMKQVEHTNDERRMLQRVKHPFLVTLWGTFQDSKNLYMVMDFVEGGELFSLLRKSQVSIPALYFLLSRPP